MRWQYLIRISYVLTVAVHGSILALLFDGGREALGAEDIKAAQEATPLAKPTVHMLAQLPLLPDFADDVQVRIGDEKLSLNEAVRRASVDRRLAEYRQMRIALGVTPAGQLHLARWCKKRGFEEEARLHWRIFLTFQPNHPEAMKRLGLHNHNGRLLTSDEIRNLKEEEKQLRKARKAWAPRLKKLRTSIKRGSEQERNAAVRELVSIRDPLAIPAIEDVFSSDSPDMLRYLIEVFAAMPERKGVEFLVRQAVDSKHPEIRKEAAYRLSHRRYGNYVPLLINGLAAPIELSTQVSKEPAQAKLESRSGYQYTGRIRPTFLHRIRLNGNYSANDVALWGREVRRVSGTVVTGWIPERYRLKYQLFRESPDPDAPYESTGEIHSGSNSMLSSTAALEDRIKEINTATARRNQRIHEALVEATGVDAALNRDKIIKNNKREIDPRLWWEWWRKQTGINNYFAKGMEVWTQIGPLPIEEIIIGDRILTRDTGSDELTFNLVVGMDRQQQSEMQVIEVGGRTIVSTPEQSFFTPHGGKRKAKELEKNSPLKSIAGPQQVTELAPGTAFSTYALLVENSSNFFVDRLGIQVSDSTPAQKHRK